MDTIRWGDGSSGVTVDFDNSFGKGLWSFLRQIVPDSTLDDPVRIFAREFLGIGTAVLVWCTIGITFKGMVGTVIVPYLRGYGTTRFLSSGTVRNGQPSVVAADIIALMDALKIEKASFTSAILPIGCNVLRESLGSSLCSGVSTTPGLRR